MDELLHERITQLEEIDERLERIMKTPNGLWDWDTTKMSLDRLRIDIALMIQHAKEEYAAF